MRIKLIIKIAIISGIFIAAGYILFSKLTNGFKKSEIPAEILHAARGINVFKLENEKFITFPLLTLSYTVRVATNAEFSDSLDLRNSSIKEPYIVEVQAYDLQDNLVETRTINYYTKTQFYFEENLGMYLPSFYLDSTSIPSETRVSTLNFRDTKSIAKIKLRRVDSNAHLSNIYARVYQPSGIHDSQIDFYWFSIMPKDQERLASANLYPVPLIQEGERQNLIKNLWTFVGPSGVSGEDYQERILYSVSNPRGIPYDVNLLHSGNYVDDNHQLVVPIQEDGSDYKLEIISADIIYPKYMKIWLGEPETRVSSVLKYMKEQDKDSKGLLIQNNLMKFSRGQNIEINWRGRGLGQTISNKESIDRHFVRDYKFNSGLVTISSNAPAYVNITKKSVSGEDESILLQPNSVNLIRLDSEISTEFDVNHDDNENTLFRIDLRKVSNKVFDQRVKVNVAYELISFDGKVVKEDVISINPPPTKLDFVVRKGNLYISDKERYYFNLPKEIAKIRFKSTNEIFISAYNRTDSLVRHYNIPEDYRTSQYKPESLRRTWFYRTPNDYESLRANQRTLMIKIQPRSIAENEFVKSSFYDWKEILPSDNSWTGIEVIEKKEIHMAGRTEAEAVEFSLIPTNEETEINIIGYMGEKFAKPTAIFSGEHATNIVVYVDQQEFYKTTLQGNSDEVQLPNINVGPHAIMIKAEKPLTAFINYNSNNKLNYLKHNILKLNNKTQTFIFEKTDDEDKVVTIKTYCNDQNLRKLMVSIENTNSPVVNSPLASYTIKNRNYLINFTKDQSEQIIISDNRTPLYGAEPIFMKLGADLPKGTYKIKVSNENGEEFYVSLSSLTPGLIDKRTISTEVQDEE